MKEVIVKDADLRQAAEEGMDAFLGVFVKATYESIGGVLTVDAHSLKKTTRPMVLS